MIVPFFREADYRFTRRINELSKDESDLLLEYLHKHVANNHDFQVRHRWTANGTLFYDLKADARCRNLG